MTLSFKEFAVQFLGLKSFPVKALDVASATGFTQRPISLRAVIGTGAPFVPAKTSVNSSGNVVTHGPPPVVVFSWTDPALTGGSPDSRRQATSWNLTVWEAEGTGAAWVEGAWKQSSVEILPGVPVLNTLVPFRNDNAGQVQYDYVSIQLNGMYAYQITAYNDYGSASTGTIPVAITVPGVTPAITVTYQGTANQVFAVKGTGFTPRGEVNVTAQVGGYATETNLAADSNGDIGTSFDCQSICSQAHGGQLQFQATDLLTEAQSNQISENCH